MKPLTGAVFTQHRTSFCPLILKTHTQKCKENYTRLVSAIGWCPLQAGVRSRLVFATG